MDEGPSGSGQASQHGSIGCLQGPSTPLQEPERAAARGPTAKKKRLPSQKATGKSKARSSAKQKEMKFCSCCYMLGEHSELPAVTQNQRVKDIKCGKLCFQTNKLHLLAMHPQCDWFELARPSW